MTAVITPADLRLERRDQEDGSLVAANENTVVLLTPGLGEDYWSYRVALTEGQAVVGFPKFFTVGIGFAVEDYSGNTNLPYRLDAEYIAHHIWSNRGETIPDTKESFALVVAAIDLIRAAAMEDRGES